MSTQARTGVPKAFRVTGDTTAVRIDSPTAGRNQDLSLTVTNRGTVAVFIGASDVTALAGFQLDPGQSLPANLSSVGAGLWAVTAASTCVLHVLQFEVN